MCKCFLKEMLLQFSSTYEQPCGPYKHDGRPDRGYSLAVTSDGHPLSFLLLFESHLSNRACGQYRSWSWLSVCVVLSPVVKEARRSILFPRTLA